MNETPYICDQDEENVTHIVFCFPWNRNHWYPNQHSNHYYTSLFCYPIYQFRSPRAARIFPLKFPLSRALKKRM